MQKQETQFQAFICFYFGLSAAVSHFLKSSFAYYENNFFNEKVKRTVNMGSSTGLKPLSSLTTVK